ncbi:MAG: SLBB domain-containing protein [Synechococcales bacterium]|nr:SLBB domain-containing protein [Synechococcales bacterium]
MKKTKTLALGALTLALGGLFYCSPAQAQYLGPDNLFPPDAESPWVNENSGSSAAAAGNYLLGVGDVVRVDVFNIPDYSGEFQVLAGGILNLPIIGNVPVEGLSLQQASAQIEGQLTPYVRRPRVTLSILRRRPLQIAIAGEVSRPGSYRIGLGNDNDSDSSSSGLPTLTQVIELAGGITQSADIRRIEVQRRLPPSSNARTLSPLLLGEIGATVPSNREVISINLWELLQDGNLDEDLLLQDGDRIIVPEAVALNPDEVTELASASFSPDDITVNVVGEVDAPGAIQVPPNTPLNQAILAAGGFNNRARIRSVDLIRLNPNGTVSRRTIDIDFEAGANENLNPPLRPNDTVVVRRSGLARIGDTVSSVVAPVSGIFSILRLFGLGF